MTRALTVRQTRSAQLGLALSPYHLTSREVPAMLASFLGDRVVTLLPLEREEADGTSPGLASLMDAWSWSAPLWDEGLLGSRLNDDDARGDIDKVLSEINDADCFAPLRPFVSMDGGEDPRRWLERVASDLLRGGPDPGLCVPMSAAIDRFAARRGVAVVRAGASSLAQQAEERLATRVFAFAMPLLAEADADRLLEARQRLEPQLDALREEVSCAFAGALGGDEVQASSVRSAADHFANAFERARADLLRTPDDPDDPRVVEAMVSVTGVLLPIDSVLRSSLAAVRRARGRGRGGALGPIPDTRVASLIVRRVGR